MQHAIRHITSEIKLCLNHLETACEACGPPPQPDETIGIKNHATFTEVVAVQWHERLQDVFRWVCRTYPGRVVVTSAFRAQDTGVHNTKPLRAVDLRSRMFTDPDRVADRINERWIYGDNAHEVCVYHRAAQCRNCGTRFDISKRYGIQPGIKCPECGTGFERLKDLGPHFHLQVRDETRESDPYP